MVIKKEGIMYGLLMKTNEQNPRIHIIHKENTHIQATVLYQGIALIQATVLFQKITPIQEIVLQ